MPGHILGSFPRAEVDQRHPDAWGVCDLCGFVRNHRDLAKNMTWRGNQLIWDGFLVCYDTCQDTPYQFDRPVVLPPDPVPIKNPRPPSWKAQEQGNGDSGPVQQLIEPD